MPNFEIIIGVEIHIELNTRTKMFSSAPNNFHALPNTAASLIDIGYPGTLPVVNKEAVKKAIMLAKALKMEIDSELHFDRKNYFYADLPKGFQITQQFRPLGLNGVVPINNNQLISIERIHLEEDTARLNHSSDYTSLDYNRAGTPLIEIVSNPVLHNAQEVVAYISTVRDIVKILNISDAKMEEGSLRADINISLRLQGHKLLGTKVEIKNLNSLVNVEKAIEKEVSYQKQAYIEGKPIVQATKRFDEIKQDVIVMRIKTDAADYRYFAEPNIPVVVLDQEFINNIKIPELPWMIRRKLEKLGIAEHFIRQLIIDPVKMKFINQFDHQILSQVVKLYFAEVIAYVNSKKMELEKININVEQFSLLIKNQQKGVLSGTHVKKIIPILIETDKTITQIIQEHNWQQISDEQVLGKMIERIISDNQKFITTNLSRTERVFKFILGQLMKASQGQANPIIANKLVKQKLEKYKW